jgi:hypothetical protein
MTNLFLFQGVLLFWIMNLNRTSNGDKPLLLILYLMKSVITNNVLYYTIHPISNVRMVLQQVTSVTSVFMPSMSFPTTKHESILFYDALQTKVLEAPTSLPTIIPKTIVKHTPDFQQLHHFFGWMSADIMQKTFEHTTQYARLPAGTILKKAFRSPDDRRA